MTKTNKTAFGKTLREARISAGRTQADVAKYLELSVAYVCDVERGYRAPLTNDRLMKAIHLLDADLSELVANRARYYGVVEVPLSGDATEDAEAVSIAVRRLSSR
jgi:transcriptional regulator with XRE-family HTH domain